MLSDSVECVCVCVLQFEPKISRCVKAVIQRTESKLYFTDTDQKSFAKFSMHTNASQYRRHRCRWSCWLSHKPTYVWLVSSFFSVRLRCLIWRCSKSSALHLHALFAVLNSVSSRMYAELGTAVAHGSLYRQGALTTHTHIDPKSNTHSVRKW